MFRRLIETSPTWMTVPVRIALGVILIAHGSQKVFGTWGGRGLAAWMGNPAPFGFMRPAGAWMAAAAFAELIGGALVLVGLLTRLGGFLIACVMLVAIFGVHWPNFFANNRGFEFPFALLAMSLALILAGGGRASIDEMLMGPRGRRR